MLITRRRRTPVGSKALQLCFCKVDLQPTRLRIDGDRVAFFDERDCSAYCCLGRNMSYDDAIRAAGKSSIGDQADRITESGADDRGGWRQHLAHAGTALRPFVTNDDNVAGLDCSGKDCLQTVLFRVEYPRWAG